MWRDSGQKTGIFQLTRSKVQKKEAFLSASTLALALA